MVVWQLNGTDTAERAVPALRVIAVAFAALTISFTVHPRPCSRRVVVLATRLRELSGSASRRSPCFALAWGAADTGRRLGNAAPRTEARITPIDGALATEILAGVVLDAAHNWRWADPAAAAVLVLYGAARRSTPGTSHSPAATEGPLPAPLADDVRTAARRKA